MSKRVVTALVGLPLLIAMLIFGKGFLTVGVILISFVGIIEYTNVVNKVLRPKINLILIMILALGILITMRLDYYFLMPILLIELMIITCFEIVTKNIGVQRSSATIFGLIYVPVMFGYLFLFENIQHGLSYMWMIFIIAFGTDTAAYYIGKKLGKTKLAPKISPKKTVAGAIGGIIASGAFMVIYGFILTNFFGFALPWVYYLGMGVIGSIAGQCGDLTASMIKRRVRAKDFGKILPGHGGVLDRFDSILFIIPLIYIFASYTVGLT